MVVREVDKLREKKLVVLTAFRVCRVGIRTKNLAELHELRVLLDFHLKDPKQQQFDNVFHTLHRRPGGA
ncbi:MAG: hypothetical protein ACM3SP_04005 [Chloroflexota bacterium]